ncbi:MAG TPA: hypothetical protein VEU32_12755 [Burkholderiales bacterium]|nr:hypothetical protein [Burkholderiales bacterium]
MKKILVLLAALAASSAAHAIGIGAKVGTTGIGGDIAMSVFPLVDARVGWAGGSISRTYSTSGASYDGKIKLNNLNALLDFHPLGPSFRLTGGVIFNDNKYDATGTPSGIPGSFNASVKGNSAAPYLGVGWGRVAGMGVNFYADLGAMFMGSPKATINANCSGLSGAQCTALQNQAATEQSALQDKLNSFKIYPVLSIGLTIGF